MSVRNGRERSDQGDRIWRRKLLVGLLVLACLTPIGFIVPRLSGRTEAWGEWGPQSLRTMLGYLPEGLRKSIGVWHAPFPNYALPGAGGSLASGILSYAASGMVGLLMIVLAVYLIMKVVKGHER